MSPGDGDGDGDGDGGAGGHGPGLPLERALWPALAAWALGGAVPAGAVGVVMGMLTYEAFGDEVASPFFATVVGVGFGLLVGVLGAVTTTAVVLASLRSRDTLAIVGTSVLIVLIVGPVIGAAGSLLGAAVGALALPVTLVLALFAPAAAVPALRWLRRRGEARGGGSAGPPDAPPPVWVTPLAGPTARATCGPPGPPDAPRGPRPPPTPPPAPSSPPSRPPPVPQHPTESTRDDGGAPRRA